MNFDSDLASTRAPYAGRHRKTPAYIEPPAISICRTCRLAAAAPSSASAPAQSQP